MNADNKSSSSNGFITCAAIILAWILIFSLPFPYNIYKNQWFFGRFVIYEQQIIFGLGLALPGLFFIIRGQIKNNPVLLIEGACFLAAAAWVRGTWFVLAFLAILFIFGEFIMKKNFRSLLNWTHYVFMMIPVFLMCGLLVLNFIRFDDMFDFGMKLQNPMYGIYLRNQNGLFSPETQFFDTIFKMLAYYASPALIQMSGVWEKSASWCEYELPCLFHNNRMLLLLIPIVLYGIYRAFCVNRKMFKIIVFLGVTALVINGVIFYMGNIVTMRYFVECYYFAILLLFAGLTAALSVKISFPLLVLIFSFYLPGNITAFTENQPELRLIKIVENKDNLVDYENISQKRRISTLQIKTDFIYKDVRWHEGVVTASQPETYTKYNTIGMVPLKNGTIVANDLSAVYIKPQKMKGLLANKSLLEFVNIKSVSKPGRIKVYIDKTAIAEFSIVQGEARTYRTAINYDLKDDAPRRLLIYFFEENTSYLPAKQSKFPAFLFDKICLSRS